MAIQTQLLVLVQNLVHERAHVIVLLSAVVDLVQCVGVEFVHLVAHV